MMKVSTIVFCTLICLCLAGCSGTKMDYSNQFDPATDFQYYFQGQGEPQHITASETGYYFLNGNYIYYTDKDTINPVLLDNNPASDCLQVKVGQKPSNCNAYVDIELSYPGFLSYYGNKLYTIQNQAGYEKTLSGAELLEISKDGSKRKSLLKFNFAPLAIAIHRGTLYYTVRDYDKQSEVDYKIMKFELNGNFNKPKEIYQGKLPEGNIMDLIPYGKNLYFLEFYKNHYRTMRYDLQTEELSRMFTKDENLNPSIDGISNDKLMFRFFNGDIEDPNYWIPYISDLEGEDPVPLKIEQTFFPYTHWDGRYIFTRPVWGYTQQLGEKYKDIPNEMKVYDDKLNVVDRFDLSFLPVDEHLLPGDDEYLFFQYNKGDLQTIRYLNKKELGTGKATIKTLIETPRQ